MGCGCSEGHSCSDSLCPVLSVSDGWGLPANAVTMTHVRAPIGLRHDGPRSPQASGGPIREGETHYNVQSPCARPDPSLHKAGQKSFWTMAIGNRVNFLADQMYVYRPIECLTSGRDRTKRFLDDTTGVLDAIRQR
jgi:hypothetical protein